MASLAEKLRCTPEEYLALERKAEYKSEYVDGEMRPMAPENLPHNLITGDVLAHILPRLRDSDCQVFASRMRIKIPATGMYAFPDVLVVCGEARTEDEYNDTLFDPALIIEVLSPSTEAFDRGAKFGHYRQLPSLQEYVLIAQDRVSVERFSRQGEQWLLTDATDLDDTVQLTSIDCELPLAGVYERVEFEGVEVAEEEGAGEVE